MRGLVLCKLSFSLNNKRVHNSLISVEDPSIHPSFPQIFIQFLYVLCPCNLSPSALRWLVDGIITLQSTHAQHIVYILTPPPPSSTSHSTSAQCLFFLCVYLWSLLSLPCSSHHSFSSLSSSQLSCCQNLLNGLPTSIMSLSKPLCKLCPELSPILHFNQHFLEVCWM